MKELQFAVIQIQLIEQLPPQYYRYQKIQFWKIDAWLYKNDFIFGDDQIAWNKLFYTQEGTDMCGQSGLDSHDYYTNFSWRLTHSSPTAVVLITSNLDETYLRYRIMRDFSIDVEKCPDGCLICKLGDTINDSADGWNVVNGLSEMTKCGSNTVSKTLAVALFGGFGKFGAGSILSNTFDIQYPHYKIKIFILWAKIDAWNNEAAQIIVDGTLVWEKIYLQQTVIIVKFVVAHNLHLKLYFLEQNWKLIIMQILFKFNSLLISMQHSMKNHLELEIVICIIKNDLVFVISVLGQRSRLLKLQRWLLLNRN